MTYATPPRDKYAPRRAKPKGPEYVLRKVPGRRFCPSCRQERPWAGGVKVSGWVCDGCRV